MGLTDTDADSIEGSNSTYEFAGMHADKPELLYTRLQLLLRRLP